MRFFPICLIALLALAAPTRAQEPGVFIDPDSPSAKEYELPLEGARRQADPAQGPSAQITPGSRESPTFGEGITSGKAPNTGQKKDSDEPQAQESTAAPDRASGGDAAVVRAATANPGAPAGGADVTLTIAGIGLGVLLLGGAAGLFWRRRA